ncbi:MAG: hypothetical protein JWN08_55 [Frankiales bacterium]|nr:hypothetical protein [Frankiales bacterium]
MTPRRRRGTVLLLAAVAVVVLVGDDRPLPFLWLPLVTGLGYLLAAAAGGRDGDLWGPGLVVTGFGLGAVLTVDGPVGGDLFAPVVLTTVGAGAVLALLLPRVGIPVDAMSVAAAVLLSGVFFLLSEPRVLDLRSPLLYGVLLASWGAWEMRPERTTTESSAARREPITP